MKAKRATNRFYVVKVLLGAGLLTILLGELYVAHCYCTGGSVITNSTGAATSQMAAALRAANH